MKRGVNKLDKNKAEIIRNYFNTDNVLFNFNEKIQLDEKVKSKIFIDINGILSHPAERDYLKNQLCSLIEREGVSFDTAAGADHSGIPFTALISGQYSKPMVYIRNSNKKHGKQNKTEGEIAGGNKAVVFTDYYSAPAKIDYAFEALNEKEADIKAVITVFNYTDENEYKGVRILSLFNMSDFIDAVKEYSFVSSAVLDKLDNKSDGKTPAYNEMMVKEGAEILLDINAVSLSVAEPYRYASGILSPIYCDNRLLISHPEHWEKIIESMVNIIETKIGLENIDVVGGTSTAGIPHSVKIAERLNKPLVYIKSDPGMTGKMSEIEGNLVSGKRILIIEDLISRGGSALKAVRKVREKNGTADYCLAIFTYEMESSRKAFEENSCRVFTVSCFSKLIETAAEKKYINSIEMEKALDWNSDPENWGRKHGYEK